VEPAPASDARQMLERVDYVILYVEDLDRSIAFYREMIGLQVKFRDRSYAEFVTEGSKFGLFERRLRG
jgi:lactoylglutathione lyase